MFRITSALSRLRALLAAAALLAASPTAFAGSCENLAVNLGLSGISVTAAVTVPGPSFSAPDGKTYSALPAFCKLSAVLTPTADSFINVELWMPTTSWNGRFQGVGNGGYAGTLAVSIPAMVAGLQAGFAVAGTDMGTVPSSNNDADLLVGHPEKWADWGWRATHLMTTTAKQLIQRYYGQAPKYSYFNGCSTGGQQAHMLAQRYPQDYDGILGGDPANNRTHTHVGVLANYQAMHATPQSLFTSTGQTQAITAAVLAACTAASGGVAGDPFLTDPRACKWDPGALQCGSAGAGLTGNCLSPEQVTAARAIYAGARNPVSGKLIFPGSVRGSESDGQFGWVGIGTQPEPPFGSLFKWALGATWQWSSFDGDKQMATVDAQLAATLNANSTDLSAFRARGGKFIMYHGWADPLIAPQESINYYQRLLEAEGMRNPNGSRGKAQAAVQAYYRLFMVPGMYHCAFGPGPNAFGNRFSGQVVSAPPLAADAQHDIFIALQQWVEKGVAPTRVVATKYVSDQAALGVQMTRPLCVFPQVPRYSGAGSTNNAANFVCVNSSAATDPAQVPAPDYQR